MFSQRYNSNNLAVTCRQASVETCHLYCQSTRFIAANFDELNAFIEDTRPGNVTLIRDLELEDPRSDLARHIHSHWSLRPEPR